MLGILFYFQIVSIYLINDELFDKNREWFSWRLHWTAILLETEKDTSPPSIGKSRQPID